MLEINVYIDIDGVLIFKNKPLPYAFELLTYITDNYPVFWLTTHCKGNSQTALKYLSEFYNKEFILMASKIKPTLWDTLKTEAIDFSKKFYWIDDQPFNSEIEILKRNDALNSLIIPESLNDKALLIIIEKMQQKSL